MNLFDVRTAFLIVGLLYLALSTAAWFVLPQRRSHAATLWCSGGLLMGAGIVLLSMRGLLAPFWTIELSSVATFAAAQMLAQSLRIELGRPRGLVLIVAETAAFALLILLASRVLGQDALRALSWLCAMIVQFAQVALHAGTLGDSQPSTGARWISRAYAMLAAAMVVRIVFQFAGWSPRVPAIDDFTVDVAIIPLAGALAAIAGSLGYVGMLLERSVGMRIASAAAQARLEEQRRLAQEIAHLDRQRSLGALASTLGHEISQPLTAILSNAQLAQRLHSCAGDGAAQVGGILERIVTHARRAGQIVDRIRSFIRPVQLRAVPVELASLSRDVARLLQSEAAIAGVSIVVPRDDVQVRVDGDLLQLSQVILNVYRNAIEALAGARVRRIDVCLECSDGRARLRVRDTGPGVDASLVGRLGKPFFTTKPQGLGLGLSISRAIVEQHGGALIADNAPGGGFEVLVDLPESTGQTTQERSA